MDKSPFCRLCSAELNARLWSKKSKKSGDACRPCEMISGANAGGIIVRRGFEDWGATGQTARFRDATEWFDLGGGRDFVSKPKASKGPYMTNRWESKSKTRLSWEVVAKVTGDRWWRNS